MHIRRGDYGKRLEPKGDRVIHGAGQSDEEFRRYFETVGQTKPLVYMSYLGLRGGDPAGFFARLKTRLDAYPSGTFLIPQIGLSMTKDGAPEQHYEHEVAAGKYDAQIEALCRGLRDLGRPAYVRIGYEFNGQWNGYRPETFKAAWVRIVSAIRRHGLDEAAAVWCYAPDGKDKDYLAYYPGDGYVDWWSIDTFSASHFTATDSLAFVAAADAHGFPVMIGESTPRKVGVGEGARSWSRWFAPYFDFIHSHRSVKGFCYISWDWAGYPQWRDWGNGRIGDNALVRYRWRREIAAPEYLHGAAEPEVRVALGLTPR